MIVKEPITSEDKPMSIGKLGQRRQVVIPKELCEDLGFEEGGFVEIKRQGNALVIKPKKVIDADDVLTPEEEKLVRKGEKDLRKGRSVTWAEAKKRLKL